jgi:hypothetical protein
MKAAVADKAGRKKVVAGVEQKKNFLSSVCAEDRLYLYIGRSNFFR